MRNFTAMPLEICCYNAASAMLAAESGADRIELCAGKAGGVTPSIGLIRYVCATVKIPVHVLLRPREGNFCYTDSEFEIMMDNAIQCKQAGAAGIVFGILTPDNTIDKKSCRKIISTCGTMQYTFHKAFDIMPNLQNAYSDILDCGFTGILTGGGKQNAEDGVYEIKSLIAQFGNAISFMPGGGIRSNNIQQIAEITKAEWFHSSAISNMILPTENSIYPDSEIAMCSADEIQDMQKILKEVLL